MRKIFSYKVLFLLAGFLILGKSYAQRELSFGIFHLTSFNGDMKLKGQYNLLNSTTNNIEWGGKVGMLSGGFGLSMKSYIFHPSFISLVVSTEYNPGLDRENYFTIPDKSETLNLSRLQIGTYVLSGKPVSFYSIINLGRSINYRDNLSKLENKNTNYSFGVKLNKFLPINIQYSIVDYDSRETYSKRSFQNAHKLLTVSVKKSFTKKDKTELTYSNKNYIRKFNYSDKIATISNTFVLNNIFKFDNKDRYQLVSRVKKENLSGYLNNEKFDVNENISIKLPLKFFFSGNYYLRDFKDERLSSIQHIMNVSVGHQLYESLWTTVFTDRQTTTQTALMNDISNIGLKIRYRKKIITKGVLHMNYQTSRNLYNYKSKENIINIVNEEHFFTGTDIITLSEARIDPATIVVKDSTGSLALQENVDYLMLQQGDYYIIQRIPGGFISEGSSILVDYSVNPPVNYNTKGMTHSYSIRASFYSNLVTLYFKGYNRDIDNIVSDFVNIGKINQKTYGIEMSYKGITGNAEYIDRKGEMSPYQSYLVRLNYHHRFYGKLTLGLGANYSNIKYSLSEIELTRKTANADITYQIFTHTQLRIIGTYNEFTGPNYVQLLLLKGEVHTIVRSTDFYVSFDVYQRDFDENTIAFKGVNFKIIRRF